LDLQASRITVAGALLVELHTASASWLFKGTFLLCLPAVLATSGRFATVNHIVE